MSSSNSHEDDIDRVRSGASLASDLLWNLYLQSSAATISMSRIYLVRGSRPDTLTLKAGNSLLGERNKVRETAEKVYLLWNL